MIPRSSVHNLQSFACQFNTGKLVTKVLKKSFSDGGANAPPCPPLATPLTVIDSQGVCSVIISVVVTGLITEVLLIIFLHCITAGTYIAKNEMEWPCCVSIILIVRTCVQSHN